MCRAGSVNSFKNVDRIPASLTLALGRRCSMRISLNAVKFNLKSVPSLIIHTFLQKHHPSESIIQIPEVDTAHTPLVISIHHLKVISTFQIKLTSTNARVVMPLCQIPKKNLKKKQHLSAETDITNSQFPINIYGIPHAHLHSPHSLARLRPFLTLLKLRLKLITPGAAPAVAIAVIITAKIIPSCLTAAACLERLINS